MMTELLTKPLEFGEFGPMGPNIISEAKSKGAVSCFGCGRVISYRGIKVHLRAANPNCLNFRTRGAYAKYGYRPSTYWSVADLEERRLDLPRITGVVDTVRLRNQGVRSRYGLYVPEWFEHASSAFDYKDRPRRLAQLLHSGPEGWAAWETFSRLEFPNGFYISRDDPFVRAQLAEFFDLLPTNTYESTPTNEPIPQAHH